MPDPPVLSLPDHETAILVELRAAGKAVTVLVGGTGSTRAARADEKAEVSPVVRLVAVAGVPVLLLPLKSSTRTLYWPLAPMRLPAPLAVPPTVSLVAALPRWTPLPVLGSAVVPSEPTPM